jgi:glycosyltransferase involved in cell wall biosynthesis
MNIAFLLPDPNISGRSRTVAEQAEALAARGHHVRIVGEDDPAPADDEIVIDEPPPIMIVNANFYRDRIPHDNTPLRVLLVGVSPEDGYGAAAHARWFHQTFELVRVAPFAPSRAEPLDAVQEFHVALSTPEMVRVIHSCDVVIAPAFGLAVAEAMAAGLAVTSIEKPDHPVELGERLIEVLSDESLRARLRAESREKAEEWRSERGGELLEGWCHSELRRQRGIP